MSSEGVRCGACGKFISHEAMKEHRAVFYFEPDKSEWCCWVCERCEIEHKRLQEASR